MAVVAALDAVLMLRLGRMRPGWPRAASAVLGTALVIVLANWAIVSGQMGKQMGLLPWESMFYLGHDFIWHLTLLAHDQVAFAWWGAALVVARSDESRVGNESVSKFRSRRWPAN